MKNKGIYECKNGHQLERVMAVHTRPENSKSLLQVYEYQCPACNEHGVITRRKEYGRQWKILTYRKSHFLPQAEPIADGSDDCSAVNAAGCQSPAADFSDKGVGDE